MPLLLLLTPLLQEPDFDTDVAPILHERCAACHAGKERKGGWSLDTYAKMLEPGTSGEAPVVGGDAERSELFRRLVTDDEFERMPEGGDPLPLAEVAAIRHWIHAGAAAPAATDVPLAELAARTALHAPAPEHYAHPLAVTALEFSPDGATLYASGVREVLAYDALSGELKQRLGGLPQRIQSIVVVDDESVLVAGGLPGSSGELRRLLPRYAHVYPASDVFGDLALSAAVSRDGLRFAAGSADGAVGCYRAVDGLRLWRSALHTDEVCDVAFSTDGRFVITASRDHSAKVYDAATGELWTSYTRHTQTLPDQAMYQHAILAVATAPDSARVVTAGEGGELHAWEPLLYRAEDGTASQMETRFKAKSHVRKTVLAGGDVLDVAMTRDTIYAGTRGGVLHALDAELESTVVHDTAGDAVFSVAVSPDGARLGAGTASGRVFVWDLPIEARGAAVRFTVQP